MRFRFFVEDTGSAGAPGSTLGAAEGSGVAGVEGGGGGFAVPPQAMAAETVKTKAARTRASYLFLDDLGHEQLGPTELAFCFRSRFDPP